MTPTGLPTAGPSGKKATVEKTQCQTTTTASAAARTRSRTRSRSGRGVGGLAYVRNGLGRVHGNVCRMRSAFGPSGLAPTVYWGAPKALTTGRAMAVPNRCAPLDHTGQARVIPSTACSAVGQKCVPSGARTTLAPRPGPSVLALAWLVGADTATSPSNDLGRALRHRRRRTRRDPLASRRSVRTWR